MKISTKVEYGLVALIDIAINLDSNEYVTATSIAERQGISKNYLEQILTPLRQSGIISGTKGSQGGYTLNESPNELKVSTILNALDISLLELSLDLNGRYNKNIKKTLNNFLWVKMNTALVQIADSISLLDLVTEYKKNNISGLMYYI